MSNFSHHAFTNAIKFMHTYIFLVFFFFSPKQHNDQQLQTYNDRFRLTESVRVVNTLKKKKKKTLTERIVNKISLR